MLSSHYPVLSTPWYWCWHEAFTHHGLVYNLYYRNLLSLCTVLSFTFRSPYIIYTLVYIKKTHKTATPIWPLFLQPGMGGGENRSLSWVLSSSLLPSLCSRMTWIPLAHSLNKVTIPFMCNCWEQGKTITHFTIMMRMIMVIITAKGKRQDVPSSFEKLGDKAEGMSDEGCRRK